MSSSPLVAAVVFHIGPVPITAPVVTTWAIMAILAAGSFLLTRRLAILPGIRQTVVEVVVTAIQDQLAEVMQDRAGRFLPLLGTLFLFIVFANLSGVVPGVAAPTASLETAAALALIVFLATQYFGVRAQGLLGYLGHFTKPTIVMLPLNLVGEITRTFSLMVRLFGNIMSGEFVIGIVFTLAGLFVPIPLMILEILVGLVQAYIFTMLAAVFIGAATGRGEAI
jgi:F-type H+-transporting ATPase subunit a